MIALILMSYMMLGQLSLTAADNSKCPEPLRISEGLTWGEEDDKIIPIAQKGCQARFGIYSCLISLTKKGERRYYAVCKNFK